VLAPVDLPPVGAKGDTRFDRNGHLGIVRAVVAGSGICRKPSMVREYELSYQGRILSGRLHPDTWPRIDRLYTSLSQEVS
jgi:hypothetical protein